MATSSLYRDLVLDTPEAARNMEIAFERAETEGEKIPWREPKICTDAERTRKFIKGRSRQGLRPPAAQHPSQGRVHCSARPADDVSEPYVRRNRSTVHPFLCENIMEWAEELDRLRRIENEGRRTRRLRAGTRG